MSWPLSLNWLIIGTCPASSQQIHDLSFGDYRAINRDLLEWDNLDQRIATLNEPP
jgi:hypothetical protein